MLDAAGLPQTLLILGGYSDIAVATAHALATRGTRQLLLAGRDQGRLSEVAAQLAQSPHTAVELIGFDALARDQHEALIEDVFQRHHDIDAAIIAFGVYGDQQLFERDGEAASHVIETNLSGVVSVTVPLVQKMREQGHGVLVVLSSLAGARPRPSELVYAASKRGLDAYVQGLSDSLHGSALKVLLVRPGFVHTRMNAGRRAKPWAVQTGAIADAILTGLERGTSRTIYVPSWLRWAELLLRLVPRPLFRTITKMAATRGLD